MTAKWKLSKHTQPTAANISEITTLWGFRNMFIVIIIIIIIIIIITSCPLLCASDNECCSHRMYIMLQHGRN